MYDVIVTGRSLPALQAALDFAEVGLRVAVTAATGGTNAPSWPVRDPDGQVAAFIERAASPVEGADADPQAAALPRETTSASPMIQGSKGQWLPQPEPNLLGIPATALASDAIAILGTGAAMRGFLDQVKPLLTVGKTQSVAELVRKRLGAAVLKRMVQPQIFERFGVTADQLDVAIAAPGLNETLTRAGALSSAVLAYADRNVARETRVAPALGWAALSEALLRKLDLYEVALLETEASEVRQPQGERKRSWSLTLSDGSNIEARAIVADYGSDALTPAPLAALFEPLGPERTRIYASAEIERPEWLPASRSAVGVFLGWGLFVESEQRPHLEATRVRLGSAAQETAADQSPGDFGRWAGALRDELDAALSEAGLARAVGADWAIEQSAAPFATVEAQAQSLGALEMAAGEAGEGSTAVAVGQVLHGDDLGVALDHAHEAAVGLRRRLLGLEG